MFHAVTAAAEGFDVTSSRGVAAWLPLQTAHLLVVAMATRAMAVGTQAARWSQMEKLALMKIIHKHLPIGGDE
jgi:hypothetical protein